MNKSKNVIAQAGTITFRMRNKKIEFLIITTRSDNYTIPKGIIETTQTARETALQETLEEAGAEGFIFLEIGTYSYQKWQNTCHVKVFLMLLENLSENWDEASFRKRKFVTFEQLHKYIKKAELLQLFKTAYKIIRRLYGSKVS
jgi:8-oxo-dGTP pyrophosphatase MutT (NUDIX family)